MNLCLRLKIVSFRHPISCCWYSLLLLVVYLLSSEMATRVIDFLKNSIEHRECEESTWRLEPVSFTRSERSVLLCIFVTLTPALKRPSMPLKIVLLLCVQKGCRPSSAYAGIGKLILVVFFLDLLPLMKNNPSIPLLGTITICATLNPLRRGLVKQ